MKARKIAFIISSLIICVSGSLASQDTLVINGRLTDNTTKEPVLFANVWLEKLEQGVQTDLNGKFHFTLVGDFSSIKKETIQARYTGYPPADSLILLINYINIPTASQQPLELMFKTVEFSTFIVPLSRKALKRINKNERIERRKSKES